MTTETPTQLEKVKTKLNIAIRPQTPKEAFEYLNKVLNKLPWYKENGYAVGLPEDPLLKQPFKPGDIENKYELFCQVEYDKEFFKNGLGVLEKNRVIIEKPLNTFIRLNKAWEFKIFPEYAVTLTKYGPGGTYNEATGMIIMLTTKQGTFRRSNPTHTIIHEMVHIGIEERIVKHFKLSHEEKERVVDLITYNLFNNLIPDYALQERGDTKIDPYITLETIENLPPSIEKFVAKYPR